MGSRSGKRSLLVAATVVAALVFSTSAGAAPGDLEYVSRGDTGLAANGDSIDPVISDDGGLVAFFSNATNLVTGATGGQVYLRNVEAGTISLISEASEAQGNTPANDFSSEPEMTGDGRFVVYQSNATNLSPLAPTAGSTRTYIRDRATGVTSLVSVKNDNLTANSGLDPVISSDGRFVAFSTGSNTNIGDVNGPDDDIILRDLQTGTNVTVSQAGGVAGNGDSDDPSISDDGRFVAFSSDATNLSTSDDDAVNLTDIFVRDLQTGKTTLVSRQSAADGGAGANGDSGNPFISGNGRFVAFRSNAANLGAGGVNELFVRDLQTNTTTLVSRQSNSEGGAPDDAGPGSEAPVRSGCHPTAASSRSTPRERT